MSRIPRFKTPRPLPPEFALSHSLGTACAPKDFDWLAKNIPCQAACPVRTDIPGYLEAVAAGQYAEAYRINLEDNVFPAVLGRVCTRPCEPACRHGWDGLGDPVAICFSKRSAADFDAREEPVVLDRLFPETGKHVAVIGAGAAGLAAARDLARFGHRVTVLERHEIPGGLMVQGIPAFRLPRALVAREVEQICRIGVTIRCGVEVGRDLSLSELLEAHDAVVLSAGALLPHTPDLPGIKLEGVMHGLPFLMAANRGQAPAVGARAVVIGGGFTAVDCARMLKRLGSESVQIYYRRSEREMYIRHHEIEAMQEEGIGFTALVAPAAFRGMGDRVSEVELVRTTLGPPDASGRASCRPVNHSTFNVPADIVVLATGQQVDASWIPPELAGQLVQPGSGFTLHDECRTSQEKLFVIGDAARGAGSLIDAIGHARRGARSVDACLMGAGRLTEVVEITHADTTGRTRDMDALPLEPMPTLALDERGPEDEVDQGYDEAATRREAQRCYLCHYKFEIDNSLCIYCDRCLKVMPVECCIVKVKALQHDEDGRITGLKESIRSKDYNMLYIDQEQCIRCNACIDVCPVDCISLQKVSLRTVPAPT